MQRAARIHSIVHSIGTITRELNVSGDCPFRGRSLGRPHMDILFLLSKRPRSIKQLSEHLRVTSSAITQFVDYLEEMRLVHKSPDLLDKRSRIVSLTAESQAEVQAFEHEYVRAMAVKFETISDDELLQLQTILHKIRSV